MTLKRTRRASDQANDDGTTQGYRVLHAFSAKVPDGESPTGSRKVWISRAKEGSITEILDEETIQQHVEAGNLRPIRVAVPAAPEQPAAPAAPPPAE